jgi:hypothetical protein
LPEHSEEAVTREQKLAQGRIPCCVPYCGRTYKPEKCPADAEVMCGKHYRLADGSLRGRLRKLWRMYRRTSDRERIARITIACERLWQRVKKQAIERAMGL